MKETMDKKQYEKPSMKVIILRSHPSLLAGSDVYPLDWNGPIG